VDFQQGLIARGGLVMLNLQGNARPHHHFCKLAGVCIGGFNRPDRPPLSHNGYAVAYLHYFIELVGYDNNGAAFLLHVPEH